MKIITAMIQPFMLNKVTSALKTLADFPGMTVTEARGFGRRRSVQEQHSLQLDEFKNKARLEIVAPDERRSRSSRCSCAPRTQATAATAKSSSGRSRQPFAFRLASRIKQRCEVTSDKYPFQRIDLRLNSGWNPYRRRGAGDAPRSGAKG